MKGRSLIFSATLILAAGLVLILTYRTTSTSGIVTVGGILFIVTGLLNLFAYLAEKPGKKEVDKARSEGVKLPRQSSLSAFLAWTSSLAALILGLSMIIFISTFLPLVPFVFALLITFGALFQFYLLAIGAKPVRLPSWLFIVPVLMIGAAIYVFLQKTGSEAEEHLIMLVTGIAFVVFSATMYIESILIGSANRRALHQAKASESGVSHESVADESRKVVEVKALDEGGEEGQKEG